MKILFVCKHNRFRSKVAESIFNALNKNPNIKAESAGIIMDKERPYIADNVLKIMKQKGYSITSKPEQVKKPGLEDYRLIVIVGDNTPMEDFSNLKCKLIRWDIPDCGAEEFEKISTIIGQIEAKVKELINSIAVS